MVTQQNRNVILVKDCKNELNTSDIFVERESFVSAGVTSAPWRVAGSPNRLHSPSTLLNLETKPLTHPINHLQLSTQHYRTPAGGIL